jgi:DNA polymerase III sliding clamp (beta) subunit (PCNA family)
MKKSTFTEDKAEKTPTGGVLVGKRQGQTIIHNKGTLSGYLVGKTHAEGGIKAVNKSTGQALEMQGGEVVITAPAVSDNTKNEFNGKMMTNREILSQINVNGGGVAFAEKGMEIPKNIKRTGASYKYGGKTMTDHEIYKYITGGNLAEGYSLREIASIHQVPLSTLKNQVRIGMKAESEHTSSKREQMKIVKDHLFENPKYYTLLKRAGLKHGGRVNRQSLVRDSKKGNTPARDLNNYNDILDIDADGMVGAETGLYVNGGMMANGGLIAPNGKPSNLTPEQYKLVRTPQFKAWFGDWENDPANASKVVDENGEPIICFHGTTDDRFTIFDKNKSDTHSSSKDFKGFFFTSLMEEAEKYRSSTYYGGIFSVFLNIKNPYIYDKSKSDSYDSGIFWWDLKQEEHLFNAKNNDGVIVYSTKSNVFVAFEPNQIKLADGTNTTFDSSNPDIRYELGGLYHGSPYSFNRFTTEKMGSGEGKQAYGWGLYFTDLEDIARIYADKLRLNKVLIGGKNIEEVRKEIDSPVISWVEIYYSERGMDKAQIVEQLESQLEDKEWIENNKWVEIEIKKVLDYLKDKDIKGDYTGRNLYKVSIHKGKTPDQYSWLDWDKRININNLIKIFEGSEKIGGINFKDGWELDNRGVLTNKSGYEVKGDEMYDWLSKKLGSPKMASLFLLENGIDGIKYPAESIAKGTTSETARGFNYVVFDENAVTIEEKQNFNQGGSVGVETVLFAVRKGEPDYNEVLITNNPDKIEDAKKWALANGFDRLRISKIDMMEKPDFKKTFVYGGEIKNKFNSYEDFVKQNIGKDKIVITVGSGGTSQPLDGATEESINKQFKSLVFRNFKDSEFSLNYMSENLLEEYNSFILKYYNLLIENPKEFVNFWNEFIIESGNYDSIYAIRPSIYDENGKYIESREWVEGKWQKNYIPHYPDLIFSKYKKEMSSQLIKEYQEYLEEYAGDKIGYNFLNGGNITQYDANMEGDSVDMMFADGGAVGSVVKNWNEVPSIWKDTSKIKKVAWTNNPYDKGLYSIVAPFLGKDELRPIMTGINFDDNGITVTNAHVLITLPYPNKKFEGTYEADLSKKANPEQITIDGNYPNYSAIIPKQEVTKPFFIDVYKLLQYNNVALKFANKYTYAVNYKIEDEIVGFNAKFLNENLKTLLKLGHETAYAHYMTPRNALLLSPNKDYELGNDDIILTMPVMIRNQSYGAVDIDYGKELYVYYDFNDNEIHNADGSVAEFKMKYENNSVISKEDVNLLEKLANSRNLLQILNNVIVENGVARASDLETEFYLTGVDLPNGIYKSNKGALEITMEAIEDFPRKPIFVADEQTIEFSINSDVLEYYVDKLKYVVGKDDLRPVMKGICLHHTSNNKLFLAGTDANILLKVDITEYVEMPVFNKDMKFIIQPKMLYDFLNSVENTSLKIKSNLVATIIETDSWSFYARNIDGNYPNYNAVIPTNTNKLANVSIEPIKKAFNSELVKNYVKESDKNLDIFIFNQQDEVYIANSQRRRSDNPYDVSNIKKICDTSIDFRLGEYYIENQSVLLIMPFGYDKQTNFSFRKDIVDRVIKIVNDNKMELHYTEFNRPYVIPIHSFEFKTTTKEHKIKEQKLGKKDLEEIAEIQNIVGVSEPIIQEKKYVIESKGFTEGIGSSANKIKRKKELDDLKEKIEIQEAIETLEMLLETATRKDKKEIKEAIEVLQMLLDTYEY